MFLGVEVLPKNIVGGFVSFHYILALIRTNNYLFHINLEVEAVR
jgi:hypothetical protein